METSEATAMDRNREDPLKALGPLLQERAKSLIGTLVLLSGKAELRDPLSKLPHAAEQGMRLAKRCILRVESGSALVRMDDGSDFWLAEGAELDLSPWTEARRALLLAAGRVLSLIAPDKARPFSLFTASAEIMVTGTAFQATASRGGLDVAILHGSVRCRAAESEMRGERGWRITLAPGKALQTSRFRAEDLARFPQPLIDASAANARIRPAFRAVGSSLYPVQSKNQERPNMNDKSPRNGMKWAMLAVALVVGGYFAWSYLSPGGEKQKATAEFHDAYKIDGGKTVKLSDSEAKAQMPPAIADLLTSQTKPGTYNVNGPNSRGVVVIGGKGTGDGTGKFVGGAGSGWAWDPSKGAPANLPAGLQGIGQAKSNIDDLVKSGMPLDQAIKSVEKGLDESMNAMNAAQGGGKTHTHIEYDGEKFSISSQTSPPDGK